MDGKIFVYLVCLAGIIGLIVFVNYSNAIDEGTQQLALTQQQIDSLRSSIRFNSETLELRKEVAALLTASDIMDKELDTVRREIQNLRDSEVSLKRAFEQAVLQVRADAVGAVFPVVNLNNGTTLKNARVQSIESDILTIIHSEGVTKVEPENLPPELQERFRFGIRPGNSATTNSPQVGVVRSSASLPASAASAPIAWANTTATDNHLRAVLQMGPSNQAAQNPKKKGASKAKTAVADVNENGNPALWNSVTRESLGRAYIPGQGWLEVGPNGPVPGTGRK